MKVIDKKCAKCGKIKMDAFDDEKDTCCGEEMKRVYGYNKDSEFIPGMYSHFTHEDILLESREDYNKAYKKYKVDQMGGKGSYQKM